MLRAPLVAAMRELCAGSLKPQIQGGVRRTPWQTTRLSPLLADRRLYAHEGPSLPGLGTMPGRVLRAAL